jgi:hypothetical protein
MTFAEAIKQGIPLQVVLPDRRRPFELDRRGVAEIFLAETTLGAAVIWLEPDWCEMPIRKVARISYADPLEKTPESRWVDEEPRYGPHCIAYQKPFLVERLTSASPAWNAYSAWSIRRAGKGRDCDREAAWKRIEAELAGIVTARLV